MNAINIFVIILTTFNLKIIKCGAETLESLLMKRNLHQMYQESILSCAPNQQYICVNRTHFQRCEVTDMDLVPIEATRFKLGRSYPCNMNRCCVPNLNAPCSANCPKLHNMFLKTPSETDKKYKFNYDDLSDMLSSNHGKTCYHKLHNPDFNINTMDYDVINYIEKVMLGEDALEQENLSWEIEELINNLVSKFNKYQEDIQQASLCDDVHDDAEKKSCVSQQENKKIRNPFDTNTRCNQPHIVKIIQNFITGSDRTSVANKFIAINYTITDEIPGLEIELKQEIPRTESGELVKSKRKKVNKLKAILEVLKNIYEQTLAKTKTNIYEEGMFVWDSSTDTSINFEDEQKYDIIEDNDMLNEDKNDNINQVNQVNTDKTNKYDGDDEILWEEPKKSIRWKNVKRDVTDNTKNVTPKNVDKDETENTELVEQTTIKIELSATENLDKSEGVDKTNKYDGNEEIIREEPKIPIGTTKVKRDVTSSDETAKYANHDETETRNKRNKYDGDDEIVWEEPKIPIHTTKVKRDVTSSDDTDNTKEVTAKNANEDETDNSELVDQTTIKTELSAKPEEVDTSKASEIVLKTSIQMKSPLPLIVGRSRNLTIDVLENPDAIENNHNIGKLTNEKIQALADIVKYNREKAQFATENILTTPVVLEFEEPTEGEIEGQPKEEIEDQSKVEIEGQVNGEIDGQTNEEIEEQINGEIEEQSNEEIKGQTNGEIEGQSEGEIEGQVNGEIDGQSNEEIKGQTNGEIEGQSKVEIEGQVNGEIDGQSNEERKGQTNGEIEGQSEGEIEEQTNAEIEGQSEGEIEEQTNGEIESESKDKIERQTKGEIERQTNGEIEGQMKGEIEGQIKGKFEGQIKGQIEGQTNGEFEGQIKGEIEAQTKAEFEGQIKGEIKSQTKAGFEEQIKEEIEGQTDIQCNGYGPGGINGTDYKVLYETLLNDLSSIIDETAKFTDEVQLPDDKLNCTDTPEVDTTPPESTTKNLPKSNNYVIKSKLRNEPLDLKGNVPLATKGSPTEFSDYLYNIYNSSSSNSTSKKMKEYRDENNMSKRNITQEIKESNKTTVSKKVFPSKSRTVDGLNKLFKIGVMNYTIDPFDLNINEKPNNFFSDNIDIKPDQVYSKTAERNKTITKDVVENGFEKSGNRTTASFEKETTASKKIKNGNVVLHDTSSGATNNFIIKEIRKRKSIFSIEDNEETLTEFK